MKCDRKCFECTFDDCICDDITVMERIDQLQRDINTQTMGKIPKARRQPKARLWKGMEPVTIAERIQK